MELQRAGGRPSGPPSVGEWSPPASGEALISDEGPSGRAPDDDYLDDEDDDDDDEEGAVTELALNWLADQDRRGPKRSAEDMVVRVDPTSATAARDRALQAHLQRHEMLKKAQVTAPWGQKPLTIGKPFSTKKHPRGKKVTKKKAVAKKVMAKKAVAKKPMAKKPMAKKKAAPQRAVPVIEAESLPLEDYDLLSTAQILSVLDQLEDDDLDLVAEYEEQHQNRSEILDAIDDLFEETAVPPAKKVPAKKAPAKKVAPVVSPDADLPIENYDRLTAAQILLVLDDLDDDDLDLVAEYEEQHQNRSEILDAIDAMFEEQEDDLPIESYDRLTAAQILLVLDDLDDDDLDLLAEYEAGHQNRTEILDAIDELLEEPPPPPLKRTFVNKAPAKQVSAKKVSAKKVLATKVLATKVPTEETPAKKAVAKKAVAKKAPARKAGAKKAGAKKSAPPGA